VQPNTAKKEDGNDLMLRINKVVEQTKSIVETDNISSRSREIVENKRAEKIKRK